MTTIQGVRTFQTREGNARYVIRDAEGKEYTTFREAIGEKAAQLEGQRVRKDKVAEDIKESDGDD